MSGLPDSRVAQRLRADTLIPASLQVRSPRECDVVDALHRAPVPQSALGFEVRPGRRYKVRVTAQTPHDEPSDICLSGPGCFRYDPSSREQTHPDPGTTVWWLDFE
jgi:hypothetical protein